MSEWLTPRHVAALVKVDPSDVRRALELGHLHGHQKAKGGHWRIDPACVDPWVLELDSKAACVCRKLRTIGRAA